MGGIFDISNLDRLGQSEVGENMSQYDYTFREGGEESSEGKEF